VVTIDPHLHRYASLDEIYTIPTFVARSAPLLAAWIVNEVDRPLFIGPDSESAQWVADVAERAGAPHVISTKIRRGDRSVEVSLPDIERYRECTPVLVDDIISTGRTMAETMKHLHEVGIGSAICVGVHAVFAGNAHETLMKAGAGRVATCDTIPHPTNVIRTLRILAPQVRSSFSAPLRGAPPHRPGHEGDA
jgi:ribose-phosphate pyrophosphokinase